MLLTAVCVPQERVLSRLTVRMANLMGAPPSIRSALRRRRAWWMPVSADLKSVKF